MLIATAAAVIFAGPTLLRLADDLRARSSRSFSLIPRWNLHLGGNAVRLLCLGATAFFSSLIAPDSNEPMSYFLWFLIIPFFVGSHFLTETKRRLYIDAETGLITWTRINRLWPFGRGDVAYIDPIAVVDSNEGRRLELFGIAVLHAFVRSNTGSPGSYSRKELLAIESAVNGYLEAFARHDTEERRDFRAAYREALERMHAPRRRQAAEKQAAHEQQVQRAEDNQGAREAWEERERLRKLDDKFR
ncbi:MAG: hypothetical protein DRJ42_06595 [Deltaproteobacteria bacterium]|nr:MAG: hypothetical protein DRJ42_06595 [Deltaproteobacteria bacterium]